jgi:hypothetical protein
VAAGYRGKVGEAAGLAVVAGCGRNCGRWRAAVVEEAGWGGLEVEGTPKKSF